MDCCQSFADNLNAIRKVKHFSLMEFSQELGIPKSTLHSILDDGNTSLYTALCIADSLGVPLSSLTGEMVPGQSLDWIISLLTCLGMFDKLSSEKQKIVAAHISAILEVLQQ